MGNKNQSQPYVIKENDHCKYERLNKACFEIIEVIGRGGFGKVWKVYNKKYKTQFAMKEMLKKKIIFKRSEKSIKYERELLSRMNHPFIANMHFAFQDADYLYLGLDLLTGGDLRYHLCKHRRFTEEQTKFFVACMILGFDYIHSNNILHRDIKPENLVLDHRGYVKITDFGIAKAYQKENASETSGTPGYMSPEVLCSLNHTIAVDYFALGVITYEFMHGVRPYLGRNRKEIKEKIMAKKVEIKLTDIPYGWSVESVDFINRLLQRKPANRLGNNGAHELKNHPWFKYFDWKELYLQNITAPFQPKKEGNHDIKYCQDIEKIGLKTKESYTKITASETYMTVFNEYYYFDRILIGRESNKKDYLKIKQEMKLQQEYINPHTIFIELEEKEQKAFQHVHGMRDDSTVRSRTNLSLYDKHYKIGHQRCNSANIRWDLKQGNDPKYDLDSILGNDKGQKNEPEFSESKNTSTRRTGSGNNYY